MEAINKIEGEEKGTHYSSSKNSKRREKTQRMRKSFISRDLEEELQIAVAINPRNNRLVSFSLSSIIFLKNKSLVHDPFLFS